ncbi:GrpE protein [Lancefieldella parvula DSM 20469]|uniref:Protein GrpE n=1 Tax=Lancefieldella parvula (strain ATCC 33793 / DSM 20469 / CCUG 32760 / JCM 10300 / KCTC 3663 / VPI 0546 / 1246) TaxID=521095 RepID=C8W8U3_LANP1|nr:nucleotide exchange factor GrpE [Lancefieldella parvula]ACV50531.1 GrpE protein [Lancefieldella parvula DSM 20469]
MATADQNKVDTTFDNENNGDETVGAVGVVGDGSASQTLDGNESAANGAVGADRTMTEEEMVAEAIRRGEETAEAEIAADAERAAQERDCLQNELNSVSDQIESAKQQAAEANDRFLRLQADWDNYRRRTAQERLDERQRATEKLVVDLLPVIDDLERAIEHADNLTDPAAKQFVEGVDAICKKLVGVLNKEGVEVVNPVGEAFDPLSHQAVSQIEDTEAYDETVAQVYQKGYRMGGKDIRTAMVVVTHGGPKRPAEAEATDGVAADNADAADSAEATDGAAE